MHTLKWAYGVTTVPERFYGSFLDPTLRSLENAGFDSPLLFIDGERIDAWDHLYTIHHGLKSAMGNWFLALWELFIRNPNADRYAIFQDDIVCSRNLREYLEYNHPRCVNLPRPNSPWFVGGSYPEKGYLNLYTDSENTNFLSLNVDGSGWYLSNQRGRGAQALIFDNITIQDLLTSPYFLKKFKHPSRSKMGIDGAVHYAIAPLGYKEYVHYPSLVQHIGHQQSTLGHAHLRGNSPCFMGEEFDLLSLINK